MKIALCFSGQLRSVDKAYDYYARNLFEHYDVDVFVHTWRKNAKTEKLMLEKYLPIHADIDFELDHNYLNTKYPRILDPKHPACFTVQMFYSIFASNQLKKQHELKMGFEYDWVIRSRFDYALNRFIDFDECKQDVVYVPNKEHHHALGLTCNDQFAWGSSPIMDKYCNTFMNLDRLYVEGFPMNGEQMLSGNLQLNNLILDKLEYCDMNPPFPPGEYNGTQHSLIRDDMKQWQPNL